MLHCKYFSSYKTRPQEKQHISFVRNPTAINITSGVAIPGPTRALAQASTYLALALKTDKNHVIIY